MCSRCNYFECSLQTESVKRAIYVPKGQSTCTQVEQKVLEFNGHFEKLLLGAGTGSAARSARHKRVTLS